MKNLMNKRAGIFVLMIIFFTVLFTGCNENEKEVVQSEQKLTDSADNNQVLENGGKNLMSDRQEFSVEDNIKEEIPGMIIVNYDSGNGCVMPLDIDMSDATKRYPWMDGFIGPGKSHMYMAWAMAKKVQDDLSSIGINKKVRFHFGPNTNKGLPAENLIVNEEPKYYDLRYIRRDKQLSDAYQWFFNNGSEFSVHAVHTGAGWDWDGDGKKEYPSHFPKKSSRYYNSEASPTYYTELETIGYGQSHRNHIDGMHKGISGWNASGAANTEGESYDRMGLFQRPYWEKGGLVWTFAYRPSNFKQKNRNGTIWYENSWPFWLEKYNYYYPAIYGGMISWDQKSCDLYTETLGSRKEKIEAIVDYLKNAFRICYNGEGKGGRKPLILDGHCMQLKWWRGDNPVMPESDRIDYWEALRRFYMWALSGGDNGTEFLDSNGNINTYTVTKRQLAYYWLNDKKDFKSVISGTMPGVSQTCPYDIPWNGNEIIVEAEDMPCGDAKRNLEEIVIEPTTWAAEWVNFNQQNAVYTIKIRARAEKRESSSWPTLLFSMGGHEKLNFVIKSIKIESAKYKTYEFDISLPDDLDGDGENDVFAIGNYLKFELDEGSNSKVSIDKITLNQKTILIQQGLRGKVVDKGIVYGSTESPENEVFEDEFYINGNNDYRAYFKFDLSSLESENEIEQASVSLFTSSFIIKHNLYEIERLPIMDIYRTSTNWSCDNLTGINCPKNTGKLLDTKRIECGSLWWDLDVTNAVRDAHNNGEKEVAFYITFNSKMKNNLGIYNSKCEKIRWRPKLKIDCIDKVPSTKDQLHLGKKPSVFVTPMERAGFKPVWEESFPYGELQNMQYVLCWEKGSINEIDAYTQPGSVYLGVKDCPDAEMEINHLYQGGAEIMARTIEYDIYTCSPDGVRAAMNRTVRRNTDISNNLYISSDKYKDNTTFFVVRKPVGGKSPIQKLDPIFFEEDTSAGNGWAHIVVSILHDSEKHRNYMTMAVNGEVKEFVQENAPDNKQSMIWDKNPGGSNWSVEFNNEGEKNTGRYYANFRAYSEYFNKYALESILEEEVESYRSGINKFPSPYLRTENERIRFTRKGRKMGNTEVFALIYAKQIGERTFKFDGRWSSEYNAFQAIEWDFGDGQKAIGEKLVTHKYEKEGKYKVDLTVTNPRNRGKKTSTEGIIIEVKDMPSLMVKSPNGGEIFNADSNADITWYSEESTGKLEIEYSDNWGWTWNTIAGGISSGAGEGSFTWNIPQIKSNTVRIRIKEDGIISDMSDGDFTIK